MKNCVLFDIVEIWQAGSYTSLEKKVVYQSKCDWRFVTHQCVDIALKVILKENLCFLAKRFFNVTENARLAVRSEVEQSDCALFVESMDESRKNDDL